MKFFTAILALATVAYALPNEQSAAVGLAQSAAQECGAAGSCKNPFMGSQLCNDRCKQCQGDSGYYSRGDCCGAFGLTCCCYYS